MVHNVRGKGEKGDQVQVGTSELWTLEKVREKEPEL
jgi:hypothetical protein